jgi:hypothetical protein
MTMHPQEEIKFLHAMCEQLRIENIQMQAALGYGIPAEDERHIIPSNPFTCGTCGPKADEITRLTARVVELEGALREMKEMTEYWIGLGMPEKGASKERYDTWLALGHHSKAMSLSRAALTQPAEEGEG